MNEKLFNELKTRGSSFGLSNDALEGVVELLSANLNEESNDEDLQKVAELGLGIMKTMQSGITKEVTRISEKLKPKEVKVEKPKEEKPKEEKPKEEDNQLVELIKGLQSEIQELKGVNVRKTRQERLNELYKDLPKERKNVLLNRVNLIEFPSEEAFESYLESEKPIVADLVAKAGADKVNSVGAIKQGVKVEKLPDEEKLKQAFQNLK